MNDILNGILIVDDHLSWRESLQDILLTRDLRAQVAATYAQALGELRRHRFSLCVCDLKLAQSSLDSLEGLKILSWCQAYRIPTIVVTALEVTTDIADACYEDYGAYYVFEKHLFREDVFLRIAEEALSSPNSSIINNELVTTPSMNPDFQWLQASTLEDMNNCAEKIREYINQEYDERKVLISNLSLKPVTKKQATRLEDMYAEELAKYKQRSWELHKLRTDFISQIMEQTTADGLLQIRINIKLNCEEWGLRLRGL